MHQESIKLFIQVVHLVDIYEVSAIAMLFLQIDQVFFKLAKRYVQLLLRLVDL